MLLTITTTHQPATDLGFLLHKHPDRFQSVKLSVGKAHIFYPESSEEKTTIALLLDIDPIEMIRGGKTLNSKDFALKNYVNDRPYVASSFMSVAIAKAFSTALNGTCAQKPELVGERLPFKVKISVLPSPKGGAVLIRKLFEPLGYKVALERHILDEQFPDWGESKYFTVELENTLTLSDLLSHLYVLIPTLDNDKHYFISKNEIDKLLEKGKNWLENHPEKEQIINRYLIHLKSYARIVIDRLNEKENLAEELEENAESETKEVKERKESLHKQRLKLVVEQLKTTESQSVLDLGCGEGKLLKRLLKVKKFTKIVGMDVSYNELLKAKDNLRWDRMPLKQKERIELIQGSLAYRDKRLEGFDAATIVEVIEHMDENRLPALVRVVFEFAQPKVVIVTTPNAEYNALYESMKPSTFRHHDHRFEWTRNEFETWAKTITEKYNYSVEFLPIGEEDEKLGAPSQMAIFYYGN